MTATMTEPPADTALRAITTREDLLRALKDVTALSISNRPPVPVLGCAHLRVHDGVMHVRGFDYEVSATASFVVTGGSGEALVPARHLIDLLSLLPKKVGLDITTVGRRVEITAGMVTYRLPSMSLDDYPAAPDLDFRVLGVLAPGDMAALARITAAAGTDDTLPILTQVNLDAPQGFLTAAATNRYMLSAWESQIKVEAGPQSLKVPAKTLVQCMKGFRGEQRVSLRVAEQHGDTWVGFSSGYLRVEMRTMTGDFPKWRSLIPTEIATKVTLDRKALSTAIQQVSAVLTRDLPVRVRVNGVKTVVEGGEVSDENMPYAKVTVESEREGEPIEFAMNPRFGRNAIDAIESDTLAISIAGPNRPMIFREPGNDAFTMLVMPVRLHG